MADILITGDGKFPTGVQVPIVSAQKTTEGTTVIAAEGEYRGRLVGVEVSVRGQMKPGIIGDEIVRIAFYGSGVLVRGIGDLTRNLGDVFSEAYILPVGIALPLQQRDLTGTSTFPQDRCDSTRRMKNTGRMC